jgi:hypothetical protein
VAKNIIVHIDVSKAGKEVRTNLFSSTREGFKDDRAKQEITDLLEQRMEEDDRLDEIERELLEDLLDEETEDTDEEVRDQITQLLQNAGFEVGEPGEVREPDDEAVGFGKGGGGGGGGGGNLDPIQTLPFPNVSFFEIAYPEEVLEVPVGGNHTRRVRIKTDASFRFDREGNVNLRSEPSLLEIASEIELRNGHKYWRLRTTEEASVGDTGEIIVTLTMPDGSQEIDRVNTEVVEQPSAGDDTIRGEVPSFQIEKVDPEENPDRFFQIWDVNDEDIPDIAYRSQETKDGVVVFYSTGFEPYQNAISEMKDTPGLLDLFKRNYKIWVGYHAILQSQQRQDILSDVDASEETVDSIQERERALVAIMQAEQATRTARTQQEAISERTSS